MLKYYCHLGHTEDCFWGFYNINDGFWKAGDNFEFGL